jgi:ABC-type branched-subunit amino acid transport system ATPase component
MSGPRLVLEVLDPLATVTVARGTIVALRDDDRVVAALVGPVRDRGVRLELDGRRLARRSTALRVRAGLAIVSGVDVAGDVTVHDHLAAVLPAGRARRLVWETPVLHGRGDDPAGVLSGGERRLLGWLLAAATEPRAVVLDRAGTGLDADALAWAHERVDGWLARGAAVLVRVGRTEETRWLTHRADGTPR